MNVSESSSKVCSNLWGASYKIMVRCSFEKEESQQQYQAISIEEHMSYYLAQGLSEKYLSLKNIIL